MNTIKQGISRGDIFYADLSPVVGCEQGGVRPVLILQNDIGNRHSPTTIVCAITGKPKKASAHPCGHCRNRKIVQGVICTSGADTHHRPDTASGMGWQAGATGDGRNQSSINNQRGT